MRSLFTPLLLLIGLSLQAQTLSFPEWQLRSERDVRLKPRYSDHYTSEKLRDEDVAFRKNALAKGLTPLQASDSLVALGLEAVKNSDQVQAFYRMNQAYLLMPTNSEARRGFGAVFMSMLRPQEAHDHYSDGLELDSTNAKLMRDEGLAFMQDRYEALQDERPRQAEQHLTSALDLFAKAYALDPDDNTTTYYVFVTNLLRMNCDKAWEFHDKCLAQNGRSIEHMYELRLQEACKR